MDIGYSNIWITCGSDTFKTIFWEVCSKLADGAYSILDTQTTEHFEKVGNQILHDLQRLNETKPSGRLYF
jgi:Leu/Phe-tRNA-protein transferase